MSVTKAYTNEEKIESFLNITIAEGEADNAINSAVAIIDAYTGRNFIADSEATARLFNGNGKLTMLIDECVEITKVEVGSNLYGDSFDEVSAGGSAGYYKMPNNAIARLQPITGLNLRSRYWVEGLQNQRITAKWGYTVAVPEDISFVATAIAGGIYQFNRGGDSGNIKSEKIGNYAVSYKDKEGWTALARAKELMQNYRKINL